MNLQTPERMSLIRVWDAMYRGARKYVEEQGFIGVHNAPEVVGITGACENVDTLFKVDFFGRQGYLAQSDQLYLELLTPSLGKVYAEIQSFRAEPDVDARHLCQFGLFEIEHQGDLSDLQNHITNILKYAITEVVLHAQEDLEDLGITAKHLRLLQSIQTSGYSLRRVTYTDAIEFLRKQEHYSDLVWGDDLKAHHEAAIVDHVGPCFITHYPLDIKFFNMEKGRSVILSEERHGVVGDSPDGTSRGEVVNSCDLLLPYAGESAGAAERLTQHDEIEARLKASDMYARLIELGGTDEDFAWYLDAHKDKEVPPHAGAGIGMARVAQFIIGASDIRDAVPFVINRENLL